MFRRVFTARHDKRGRLMCYCGGYHFPHRKGGGACEHSKTRDIHLAIRRGEPEQLLEALIAFSFDHPGKPHVGPCPF